MLADRIAAERYEHPVVLALPRGGVPVAVPVAQRLNCPLDLVFVRKIGVPRQPELAAAAVVNGDSPELVVNEDIVAMAGVSREFIEQEEQRQLKEISRRRTVYLQGRRTVPLAGRTAILVDDGLATGASMRAAVHAVARKRPLAVIVAVPVAPLDTVKALRREANDVIVLDMPDPFLAIGCHYGDFHQLEDHEIVEALADPSLG